MLRIPATITIDIDPIIRVGGLAVHWYGVMYALAFVVGYTVGVRPYLQRRGIRPELSERMTGWVIVAGLVGARLYYDIQQPLSDYVSDPVRIVAVWQGGMDFFGAILGSLIAMVVLARVYRLNAWVVLDAATLFAVLGQPIGRIGNVINGDILGGQTSLPWGTEYTNPNAILQTGFVNCFQRSPCFVPTGVEAGGHPLIGAGLPATYHPAAVYEALGTILIGVILYMSIRRRVAPGSLWISYVGLYAVSQLIIFEFRASEPVVLWQSLGFKQSQYTSVGLIVIVVPLLVLARRRRLFMFSPAEDDDASDSEAGQPSGVGGDPDAVGSTDAVPVAPDGEPTTARGDSVS